MPKPDISKPAQCAYANSLTGLRSRGFEGWGLIRTRCQTLQRIFSPPGAVRKCFSLPGLFAAPAGLKILCIKPLGDAKGDRT